MMRKYPCAICLLVVLPSGLLFAADDDAAAGEKPRFSVSVSSAEREYVLGQVVRLDVQVCNLDDHSVRAYKLLDYKRTIDRYVSRDGEHYTRRETNLPIILIVAEQPFVTLKPGACLLHRLLIPRTFDRMPAAAFGSAGTYWIKVTYPLRLPQHEIYSYESEPIKLEITEPHGQDGEVWKVINNAEFRRFMELGRVDREHKHLPLKAMELLKKYPGSAYELDLRFGLTQFLFTPSVPVSIEDRRTIRKVLGFDQGAQYFFRNDVPTDRRLDLRWIRYEFSGPRSLFGDQNLTSLGDALEVITRKSGVPLRIDADSGFSGNYVSKPTTTTLRRFMQSFVHPGRTTWVRDGQAYVLKAVEARKSDTAPGNPVPAPLPER